MEVHGCKTEEDEIKETETLCAPCKREDLNVSANGMCNECEEYMCQTCFGHHLKAKSCSHHVLLEGTNRNKQRNKADVEICTRHENEKVKFFCRKHAEVGCGDCMVLEHNACKPEYIKELSKDLSNEKTFQSVKKKMNELEVGATDAFKLMTDQRTESNKMLEKTLDEIRNFRKMVNDYLDKAEAKVISEAKNIHSENETRMKNVEDLVKPIHTDMKELQQELSEETQRETALFINSVRCKPKLDDTERSLNSTKADNFITLFEFKVDEKLMGLVSSEQQFGHFSKRRSNTYKADGDTQGVTKWRKSDLKQPMFQVGVRVRRGPDWNSGKRGNDGNGLGTVAFVYRDHSLNIEWDNGNPCHPCSAGANELFTIQPA